VDQRELVERARRGDHDAFATLARVFVARLDASARLILRDPELAQDAVQEGFIRAWRSLPSLRDPDRFEGWLRSLIARSCLDILRKRGRRPIEVELASTDGPATEDTSAGTADRELLDAILRRLPPDQRVVVVLRYYLDLEVPEIAMTLAIPVGTAKSRLHRAMSVMRVALADVDPEHAAMAKGQPA
jgi:RNA polymerase sigma-70 factor (ECF subfamily)